MRKTALAVVILLAALYLFASGTERDTVKVYFTVAESGLYATQLWRCNRDASSDPELLYEGSQLGDLAIDSESQMLFFGVGTTLMVAGLDGSNPTSWGSTCLPQFPNDWACHIDANGGYICGSTLGSINSLRVDGSDSQIIQCTAIPGTNGNVIADVALYAEAGSPVEFTTWGKIKSRFR